MRRLWFGLAVVGGLGGFVAWWRQHPRTGAAWVNRVVDPWLVRQGVISSSNGEIGLLEHVGRKSGVVRRTPVHPVRTPDGFRIIAPLGLESQWAQNVLSAGHCRLRVGETVHELDEPLFVLPSAVNEVPKTAARFMEWLGFRYLVMHQFAEHAGALETTDTAAVSRDVETEIMPPEAIPVG